MHQTEYRVKILDVDGAEIRKRIKKLGVDSYIKKVLRRHVYSSMGEEADMMIGLRDDGKDVTLSVKDLFGDELDEDVDVEIGVDNFDKANAMLERFGFSSSHYQEHKRITFKLDEVEVHVDYWPKLPPYVEIIGHDQEDVEKAVEKLGFKMSDTTTEGVVKVYKKHGINVREVKDLKF
jgi:adenylate cyclase class 2